MTGEEPVVEFVIRPLVSERTGRIVPPLAISVSAGRGVRGWARWTDPARAMADRLAADLLGACVLQEEAGPTRVYGLVDPGLPDPCTLA